MKPAQISRTIVSPASWSALPWGEYYREALNHHLEPYWSKLFGFHLLKIGHLSAELATEKCAISHQISMAPEGDDIHIFGDAHQFPFSNKSIDACVLAHTLNYSSDPHRILREVDRVLIDDGWLILSNFNPMSIVGAASIMPILKNKLPYCSRLFSQMRLLDWLQLLNYEIVHQSRFQVLPWSKNGGELLSAHLPVLGCMSLIIARKRTIPMTLNPLSLRCAEPRWRNVVGTTKNIHRRS